MTESIFSKLYKTDVSKHIEKKGKFAYLSWAYAVKALREADPKATWEIIKYEGKPFVKTECGYFVEVAVTVEGVTLAQVHPVLDNNNRTVEKPNAFQINTSIQRALTKAIALHGLGLHIYQGEDLPTDDDGGSSNGRTTPFEGVNGGSTPPLPTSPEPKKKGKNFKFLEIMQIQKKRIGEKAYYAVLGLHGFEKSSEIIEKETQTKVYYAMLEKENVND